MKTIGIKDVMSKTKNVAAATTLVASLGVVSNAHADEVTDNTQSTTQSVTEATQVTQADVESSKVTLDNANQAVSAQEQVVKEAATTADNAQAAYDQAKENTSDAQDLVNQATPENIAAATDDVTTAENQVTTAENLQEQAETTQSTVETAVANQTQTVSQAQDQVTTSQTAVDAAQKDVNDKQAILDGTGQSEIIANRDNAQAAVNTAQDHVSQAESDLTKAQEADANRQQAIDKAQKDVDAASKNVSTTKSDLDAKTAQANNTQAIEDAKQAAVDAAQKDVNDKQAILDGTGQKAILDEADAAKVDKANKETALTDAQKGLKEAQEADANRQVAIDEAQKAVDEANQNVVSTKSDLDAQTAQAQQAAQALESAQTAYTTAENDYKSINTIRLSQAYVDALKVYADRKSTTEQKAKATETLKVESARLAKENAFKVNPSDDNVVEYDINNLPETVKQEISLFASDLINQIRKTFGTPETVVTTSSIKFADLVTSGYVADHWSVAAAQQAGAVGHDAKAVNEAAAYFGLPTTSKEAEAKGWQYYENFGAETGFKSKQSLAVLKNNIYTVLWNFMFDAGEWYHASSIVGVDKKLNSLTDKTYFAVEPSDPGFYKGFHFLLIDSPDVISATKKNFNTTQIVNPYSSDKIIATYNTAKADLEAKTATNNSVQSALSAAQNNYNNAVAINTKAQQVLDEAQSVAVQTPTAQANLTLAETALTQSQERLTKATQAVDALNADIKAKQAALTSAKAVLATAQSELAKAQANNKVSQEAKMTAQTAYDNAVSQLSSVNANLTQVQSVAVQTPTAQANLSSAKATLIQAQENLVKAQEAVDDLSADITVKQANLVAAKEVLASKQADLTAKQDVLTQSKARLASLQADLLMAQENVVTAKANVDKAKAILGEAQATLANLKNAPQLLKEAQAKEAIAKANLLDALDSLEAELLKLKDLQVKQVAAQAVYDATSKAYQDVLDSQEKARLQAEYDNLVAQGKQPIPVMDETGKITGYTVLDNANQGSTVVAEKQTATVTPTATKASTPVASTITKQTANSLPMTGDATSTVAILFGTVLTLFGLIGVRKKETK